MAQITKLDAAGLFRPDIMETIMEGARNYSVAMRLFTRLPNGSTSQKEIPVLSSLPVTYWVNESTNNGRKQTTNVAWDKKKIVFEELACIIPIKENLYKDNKIDWERIMPLVEEAMGKKFDQAVFDGTDRPASFRSDLLTSIVNAGKLITPNVGESIYSQFDRAMAEVEESGYDAETVVGGTGLKQIFRQMVNANGDPLVNNEITALGREYVKNGAWDATVAKFIVGDFSQAVYSIREDVEYKVLTEGVIQDGTGAIMYNLAQEDMVALRVTFRIGWEIPNPVNSTDDDETSRFPFAAVAGSSGVTTQNVTFTITDADEDPITDVTIVFAGIKGVTGEEGTAVIAAQAGSYDYIIKKAGYNTIKGTATVASSAVSIAATLIAR